MAVAAKSKRKRCENWCENEKNTLFTLLEDRVDTIECKQTDYNTNKKKIAAWREIEEKFNMIFPTNRSLTQLKEQWKRMKVSARKNIADYKRKQKATGGGTNDVEVTEMDWRIHSLLPHEFVKDSNVFDNDHENIDVNTQSQNSVIVEEIQHQALVHREEYTDRSYGLIRPNEFGCGSYIEEHSYSILHNNTQDVSIHPDNNNISQAVLINTASAECGTDTSMTPRSNDLMQSNNNTVAERGTDTRTPRSNDLMQSNNNTVAERGTDTRTPRSNDLMQSNNNTVAERGTDTRTPLSDNLSQAAINASTTRRLGQAHTEHETPRITQGSSRRTRTSTRSIRTRNLASESEYHRLLVERKSEEYDLKIKHMKEIHELEKKKRNIEVENLLLVKEKIKLEIEILKKQK